MTERRVRHLRRVIWHLRDDIGKGFALGIGLILAVIFWGALAGACQFLKAASH